MITTVLLVIHLFIAVGLVAVILLQRSEGGGLGIGSSGGMGQFMTARGTANLLTRSTSILGAAFFCTSITLAILAGGGAGSSASLMNEGPAAEMAEEEFVPAAPVGDETGPAGNPGSDAADDANANSAGDEGAQVIEQELDDAVIDVPEVPAQ